VAANSGLSFLDSEVFHQHDSLVRVEITGSATARQPMLEVSTAATTIEVKFTTFLILSE
jgi:hypothetical protein